MAVVLPFAAFRYDEKKIGSLSKVVTEPFDKITPEMRQEYFQRSPYNYARLIKGETRPSDTASDNAYTRAAAWLREWCKQQILVQSAAPAFYAYYQKFTPPNSPGGPTLIRKGFVGLGQIERYENGIIFPH